jgi:hypothetical protein
MVRQGAAAPKMSKSQGAIVGSLDWTVPNDTNDS